MLNIDVTKYRMWEGLHFTAVGSRAAPEDACDWITGFTHHMAEQGCIMRSGHAAGIDEAAERGTINFMSLTGQSGLMEIYIPNWGFNNAVHSPYKDLFHSLTEAQYNAAYTLLSETGVVSYMDKLKTYVRHLFARTVHQVIGLDNVESEFLVYWAETTKSGNVKGGTRVAVDLAMYLGIPCFNIKDKAQRDKLALLTGYKERRLLM